MRTRPTASRDHAVVAGASMAGLLAARVLSGHYQRVTVLDRDVWTDPARARRGVPHGDHAHGLLSSGLTALDGLFPGLVDELVAAGALRGDIQGDAAWHLGGGRLASAPSDLAGLLVSRVTLEAAVRRRVVRLPHVTLLEGQGVAGLSVAASGRVDGVELFPAHGPPGPMSSLEADLVVDATGRRSQAPSWLHRRGFARPVQERVGMDVQYATRWFARRPDDLEGLSASVHGATPDLPRGAVALAQEGGRWVVSLNGYHGRRPPLELGAFRRWARETDPLIGALVSEAEPLDAGVRFGLKAAVRNRYDRIEGHPRNVVVVGDAGCSFNPVYGQGMSVAALEALVLDRVLTDGAADVAASFHRGVRPIVETAWRLSTGNDLALPETVGARTRTGELIGSYLRRVLVAARDDADLAHRFLQVSNLEKTPASLFAPRAALMALAGRRAAGRPARMVATAGPRST